MPVPETQTMLPNRVPAVTFKTRLRDESVPGPNPFRWQDLTSDEIFNGKKVVLFSLPVPSPPPVPQTTCHAMRSCTKSFKP